MDSKKIFFVGVIIAASGLVSPPLALLAGIVFGFSVAHPYRAESHSLAKFLLQASVIGLGFGMNLHEEIHAGRSGFVFTAISITFAIALGLLLGKWMKIAPKASFLITCGTAICGGSAIAALAPITDASEEDMAVSLGTVFTLNAVALLAFPLIGWWLHFTQDQFGLWAALAIHDTSSVVGAAAKYGPQALAVGTTVEVGEGALDRPPVVCDGDVHEEQSKGSVPVVHSSLPARGSCQHVPPIILQRVCAAESSGKYRPDSNAVSYRHGTFSADLLPGRGAANGPRSRALGSCCKPLPVGNTKPPHRDLESDGR